MSEKINCVCGGSVLPHNLERHLMSKKHGNYIKKKELSAIPVDKFIEKEKAEGMRVIAYNMDYSNRMIADQAKMIRDLNAEVIMLSEAPLDIDEYLVDFQMIGTATSHCNQVYLFIHKRLNPKTVKVEEMDGIVVAHLKLEGDKELVAAAIHLAPFKDGDKIRREQFNSILDWIKENGLEGRPIIIGGDSNMRPYEGQFELVDDVYKKGEHVYKTWPNRSCLDSLPTHVTCRFDRFWTKNIMHDLFRVVNTYRSDHYLITLNLKL